MFVKVYRYRIKPDKTEEFLEIQQRAGQIYQKHVTYRAVHLQKQGEPGQWMEIHWYPDEAAYHRSMELVDSEPEIKRLWQKFQALLDPTDKTVNEEYFAQIRSEDNLGRK